MSSACLDHLVIAAASLEQGATYIREKLDVEMQVGGQHARQGTHNLLLKLDREHYLEVIAIDPAGTKPCHPRWFALDSPKVQEKLRERPRLMTWVAETDDIHTSVRHCNIDIGQVQPMNRGELNWHITLPQDGAMPFDGLVPALIEWDTDQHPSSRLPNSGCDLIALEGYHNQPGLIQESLATISLEKAMVIHPVSSVKAIRLIAQISTPSGIVVLD